MLPAPGPAAPVSVFRAFARAWRLVRQAPFVTTGILLGTFLTQIDVGRALREIAGDRQAILSFRVFQPGWTGAWISMVTDQVRGIEWIFAHEIFGYGGSLHLAARFFNVGPDDVMAGLAGVGLVLWSFLSGGVIDRLARGRPVSTFAFFGACGVYFIRFFRLGVITGLVYWVLFRWLFPHLIALTAAPAIDTGRIGSRGALSLGLLMLVIAITLVVDYAKVRAVVEDRHSMISALAASWRFVRQRPFRTVLLFLLGTAAAAVVFGLTGTFVVVGDAMWWLLLVSLVKALLYVWLRMVFMASAVVFFQSELAHAGYTAAPMPVWPESPAAEAIGNFAGRR